MDNIFEILIYLFIIISFLSSLFRKKKKPETVTGQQTASTPSEPQSQQKKPEQEEYDLLKEIEKMFKTETTTPQQQQKEINIKEEERFEPASEYLETTNWNKPTRSEHLVENWEDKRRKLNEKRKALNEKVVNQAAMFEKYLSVKAGEEADIKKNIRKRFNDPATLKEYVVFSEIFGKPKALQE